MRIYFITVFFILSCGYHFRSPVNPKLRDFKFIAIPTFSNNSFEPTLEKKVTNALRAQFLQYGRFKLVNKAGAEIVILGAVTYSSDSLILPSIKTVCIGVNIKLIRRADDEKIHEANYSWCERYLYPAASVNVLESYKERAFNKASIKLMEYVYAGITEGF